MIELSTLPINQYNGVIEVRNKVYALVIDLKLSINVATRFATVVSEVARSVLNEQKSTVAKLIFSKEQGYYFLQVYIACRETTYSLLKNRELFSKTKLVEIEGGQKSYLRLPLKIMDISFIPSEAFLQAERERLIQQSSGEMIQEIRKKNTELSKALEDLKSSSDMIQSEKMRALGSMTAGIAHELNNPMMGILNFIQYAIKHTDKDDRRYQPLTDALREVNRCQDIITNLLTFSRMKAEGEEEYSLIKPSLLFERILQLQSYKLRSMNIDIIKQFPVNEPTISMRVNKMQQVVLNLITNSIDAMQLSEKKELTLSVVDYKEFVKLSVADTGMGIDEESLDKIFEPFFTTKRVGEGTGLGLSVSKSIVNEHNGKLTCQTTVGEGSCFTIILPIIKQAG